jgi:methylenetetrahydrofolate--tRNA-(uracil-5-)-methyltransferase
MPGAGSERKAVVIGGGLAGCEAALQIARLGHPVELHEMKPVKFSPAHKRDGFAELVCSNSLGSEGEDSAPGLLKEEMRELGSAVLDAAESARVPAGKALGVDRAVFSEAMTKRVAAEPLIRVVRGECPDLPDGDPVIVATGPLTSDALAASLAQRLGTGTLYFYDSISPIVAADSIDFEETYFANRYEPEANDYLNCPMDRTLYERFVEAILSAEKVPLRNFEAMRCFEACLPIEVLAERGIQTLAFGPMKPVGLEDPRTGKRPHAVVQLRRENQPTTLYNMVGFQTRMKWGAQKEVFRMIPGLENAEFVRFGSMHRNTYIDSPKLLRPDLSLRADPRLLFAGQIVGVEGYVESAAMGIWAGLVALVRLRGAVDPPIPPPETAIGALIRAVTTRPLSGAFSPMNVNFGLLPPVEGVKGGKEARRRKLAERARSRSAAWREELAKRLGEPYHRLECRADPDRRWSSASSNT